LEVADGVAVGESGGEGEGWLVGDVEDEVFFAFAGDAPVVVVEVHVVEVAEEDAAVDVGVAVVACPLVDVVCFAV